MGLTATTPKPTSSSQASTTSTAPNPSHSPTQPGIISSCNSSFPKIDTLLTPSQAQHFTKPSLATLVKRSPITGAPSLSHNLKPGIPPYNQIAPYFSLDIGIALLMVNHTRHHLQQRPSLRLPLQQHRNQSKAGLCQIVISITRW